MRVDIDIRRTDPIESGQQRYLWRLGGWLQSRGEDVHLITVKEQQMRALRRARLAGGRDRPGAEGAPGGA